MYLRQIKFQDTLHFSKIKNFVWGSGSLEGPSSKSDRKLSGKKPYYLFINVQKTNNIFGRAKTVYARSTLYSTKKAAIRGFHVAAKKATKLYGRALGAKLVSHSRGGVIRVKQHSARGKGGKLMRVKAHTRRRR